MYRLCLIFWVVTCGINTEMDMGIETMISGSINTFDGLPEERAKQIWQTLSAINVNDNVCLLYTSDAADE